MDLFPPPRLFKIVTPIFESFKIGNEKGDKQQAQLKRRELNKRRNGRIDVFHSAGFINDWDQFQRRSAVCWLTVLPRKHIYCTEASQKFTTSRFLLELLKFLNDNGVMLKVYRSFRE